MTIPVIYEDDDILLVNKPAGMAVQGGAGVTHPLDDVLSRQVGYRVHLVHRLDRETSGLLVVAKHPAAAREWIALIAGKHVQKTYTAYCFGVPELRGKPARTGTIVAPVTAHGREQAAVTQFFVEQTATIPPGDGTDAFTVSRLRLVLGTGRMHQIRIHLAQAHCPIIADDRHGDFRLNKAARKSLRAKTLCLAATRITLPLGGTPRTFSVSLPPHMQAAPLADALPAPGQREE
ncbi:MAG: RluA family pseudouridine synthase [Treponema sp.]|nr:RluA family pseudouridine synthase [Treponema sp.]